MRALRAASIATVGTVVWLPCTCTSSKSQPRFPRTRPGEDLVSHLVSVRDAEGDRLISAGVEALVDQTRSLERAISALGLDDIAFEGSNSLDSPDAVFQ